MGWGTLLVLHLYLGDVSADITRLFFVPKAESAKDQVSDPIEPSFDERGRENARKDNRPRIATRIASERERLPHRHPTSREKGRELFRPHIIES